MSGIERPSPRLAALVDAERAHDYGDADRSARVIAGVTKAVVAGSVASIAGVAAAGGTKTAAAAATKVGVVWTTSKVLAVVALSFIVGTVTGAGVQRLLAPRPSSPASAVVAVSTATTSPAPPLPPSTPNVDELQPTPSSVPAQPVRATASVSGGSARPTAGDLEREQGLIDIARAGLARGHPEAALEAVARHEASYPHGQLAEERDGLRIFALLRSGRKDEARVRAGSFHATYPKSVLWPRIERALDSESP